MITKLASGSVAKLAGDKYGRYLVLLPDVNAALRASGLLKSK